MKKNSNCQRHIFLIQLISLPSTNITTLTGKSESHITNSTNFIQKIQKIQLRPTNLVSFDVESFFTQVPIKDTLNIIKASHKVLFDFPLIEHCLTTTSPITTNFMNKL